MKFIKSLGFLFLLIIQGYTTEYAPWFDPLFEIHVQLAYIPTRIENIHSLQKEFKVTDTHHTLYTALQITPLPYWNLEGEIWCTQAAHLPLSYEASRVTLRHQWLDDLDDDFFALTTGITTTFPASRFLHRRDFLYRDYFESELHVTVGKEWVYDETLFQVWLLGGYGLAPHSCCWLHSLGWIQYYPIRSLRLGIYSEWSAGLGHSPLLPTTPFPGYGHIAYRKIDLGGEITLLLPLPADLALRGHYNIYARNCLLQDWSIKISLLLSFPPL